MKKMKIFYKLFTFTLLIFPIFLFPLWAGPEVKNPDRPLKGEWDFKPEHVWTSGKAGDEPLARPSSLLVSDDGTGEITAYNLQSGKMSVIKKFPLFMGSTAGSGESD